MTRTADIEEEIRRFALLAISNLASAVENHAQMVEQGALDLLISLSNHDDKKVRCLSHYGVRLRTTPLIGWGFTKGALHTRLRLFPLICAGPAVCSIRTREDSPQCRDAESGNRLGWTGARALSLAHG